MAVLRVPGPDGKVRLIDVGPGVGRTAQARIGGTGGTLRYGESMADRDKRQAAEHRARKRAARDGTP
jgi:hypothetical protein